MRLLPKGKDTPANPVLASIPAVCVEGESERVCVRVCACVVFVRLCFACFVHGMLFLLIRVLCGVMYWRVVFIVFLLQCALAASDFLETFTFHTDMYV